MSGKAVRETLAALGVIASLVFVGTEIRQNTTVAKATARQALTEGSLTLFQGQYGDGELNRQFTDRIQAQAGTEPTCPQATMCAFVRAMLRQHENVFLQVEEGLLDRSAFASYGYGNNPVYASPHVSTYWPRIRARFNPDFVAAFEAEYDLAP
jgi:hypothetical protein